MDDSKRNGECNMRMYAQYADKPKAVAWYNIVPTMASEIFTACNAVTASWDIDTNTQEQLNVIGRIVVIDQPWEVIADDEIYRLLLKSKIAKNNSDATIQGIIGAMSFIFPNNSVTISDYEDMSFDVTFENIITPTQVNILSQFDLVPKPQGVRLRGYAVPPLSTIYGNEDAVYGNEDSQHGYYF